MSTIPGLENPPTRNKKLQTDKVEKKKYNPALRRHTLHREIK